MDYRALGELIWMTLLGLSILGVVAGLSVRFLLGPVVRQILEGMNEGRSDEQARLAARLELMESRLEGVETEIQRLDAADEFYRSLGSGEGEKED